MAKSSKKTNVSDLSPRPTPAPASNATVSVPKVRPKRITQADIKKSGIMHGMVLVNPNSGEQEIHQISNARDLSSLSRWHVVAEFGSTRAIKMSDVLAQAKGIPADSED